MNEQTRRHADSEQKWNLRVLQGEANLLRRSAAYPVTSNTSKPADLNAWSIFHGRMPEALVAPGPTGNGA